VNDAPTKVAAPLFAPVMTRSLTIDMAAERDFQEVVALALFVPSLLGWYWLLSVMNRYRSAFG